MTDGIDRLSQATQMESKNANEEALQDGLDLSSAYEEVSPKNPIFDPTVTEQVGLTGAEEHALQEAGFASGGAQIDAILAEIAAVLQLVSNTSASVDEQKAAVQEKIDGLKNGLSTDTVVQSALEDLTPQQWDVIGAIITTHLQPESEPAEAGPSPDLSSSSYKEVSPKNPIYDQIQWGTQTKSENANEEALEGANKTGNFEIQRLLDNSNEEETNAASVKEKAQDVIANSSEKSKNANEQAVKDGLDLSSAYQEATPINPVFDSVYGQVQETKSSKANEEALEGAKQQALNIEQQKSLRANEQSLEEKTNKDGLDLNSAYEEAAPNNPVFDSVYGQTQGAEGKEVSDDRDAVNPLLGPFQGPLVGTKIGEEIGAELQDDTSDALDLSSAYEEVSRGDSVIDSVYGQTQGATPPKVEPSQYPPDLPSPSGGEELLPDGNANGIPGEYGDGPDLDANGVPDEIGINPDSLQPGYPNSPWASSLDPALFDPTEPGPTLDPSLFDPTSPGPTLDPSLFDPHLAGVTLDPALLDPTEPGPTLDPSQLDPSAPGPTLDLAQLEQHGVAIPPEDFTYQSQTYSPALEDPGSASQEHVPEHEDFFEGV